MSRLPSTAVARSLAPLSALSLSPQEFAVMHGALFHGKFQSDDLMRKAAKRPVSA